MHARHRVCSSNPLSGSTSCALTWTGLREAVDSTARRLSTLREGTRR